MLIFNDVFVPLLPCRLLVRSFYADSLSFNNSPMFFTKAASSHYFFYRPNLEFNSYQTSLHIF
jgi:hypothetical protein